MGARLDPCAACPPADMSFSARSRPLSERAGRQVPGVRWNHDRFVPGMGKCAAREVRLFDQRRVGTAAIREVADATAPLDGAPETVFVAGNALKPVGGEIPHARPLIGAAENAGDAGKPRPAKSVGWRRHDAVPAYHVPYVCLVERVDGPPVIDVPPSPCSSTGVRTIRLECCVIGACPTLLRALSGYDQRATIKKSILVAHERSHDIDFEVCAAISLSEVGRHLRKPQAGPGRPGAANFANCSACRLEADWRCGRVLAEHLPQETAFLPAQVERNAERARDARQKAVVQGQSMKDGPAPSTSWW